KSGLLGEKIKWNFTKFLVSREGTVIKRFSPQTSPQKIGELIQKLL
ncbi:MAG: glutathione peroxidase, partial [Streptococcus sanguinis]|nr:glutathione peroxidase [Streptococcus sanguinis]